MGLGGLGASAAGASDSPCMARKLASGPPCTVALQAHGKCDRALALHHPPANAGCAVAGRLENCVRLGARIGQREGGLARRGELLEIDRPLLESVAPLLEVAAGVVGACNRRESVPEEPLAKVPGDA